VFIYLLDWPKNSENDLIVMHQLKLGHILSREMSPILGLFLNIHLPPYTPLSLLPANSYGGTRGRPCLGRPFSLLQVWASCAITYVPGILYYTLAHQIVGMTFWDKGFQGTLNFCGTERRRTFIQDTSTGRTQYDECDNHQLPTTLTYIYHHLLTYHPATSSSHGWYLLPWWALAQ
jgi:hypothetical protein